MDKHADGYDDDVFSLDEDLAEEKKKQWFQYLLVALLAALVIAGALYGSIQLTHMRLAQQASKPAVQRVTPLGGLAGSAIEDGAGLTPAANTDYWPAEQFPGVPALDAQEYDTQVAGGCATVDVPSAAARDFDAYIETLTDGGAAVYVRSDRLSVLDLEGVEIHLIANNLKTQVALCDEPAYTWSEEGYGAFSLPQTGKLVSVKEGTGAGSRICTYRNATVLDALEYAGSLAGDGWILTGTLEPTGNVFQAVYKKNNLQTTVDYFSSGENYQVKLDFLS